MNQKTRKDSPPPTSEAVSEACCLQRVNATPRTDRGTLRPKTPPSYELGEPIPVPGTDRDSARPKTFLVTSQANQYQSGSKFTASPLPSQRNKANRYRFGLPIIHPRRTNSASDNQSQETKSDGKPKGERNQWYLTPEEASRVARGHREMMELPATTPIPPSGSTPIKESSQSDDQEQPR